MTEFTGAEAFFNFKGATDNDLANEIGSENTESPYNLFKSLTRSSDQDPEAHSTMNNQPVQREDQGAAITDPSPAMAPLPTTDTLQQWSAPSLMSQNKGTSRFTHGESTAPYQPTLQQQQATTLQLNVQQQQPAPAPTSASHSTEFLHNAYGKPPPWCELHTRMYEQLLVSSSMDKNLAPRPHIHQRPSASPSPVTQQQNTSFPPNVLPQTLRPLHTLQRPPFPQGPWRHRTGPPEASAQPLLLAPPLTQQYQQNFTHTIPFTQERHEPAPLTPQQQGTLPIPTPPKTPSPTKKPPTKGSKPTGITKKPAGTPGRKPKDHGKTGFVNATIAPEEHFNTTMYGRNSLRGAGSEARLAEPWNQPSVKGKGKGKADEKQSGKDAVVVKEAAKGPLGGQQVLESQELREVVNGEVSAKAPGGEMAKPEQEPGLMEFDEEMLNFDIGEMDIDEFLGQLDGKFL